MHPTLASVGILALLASLAYGTLGLLLWRRRVAQGATAWRAYGAWWMLVGGLLALSGISCLIAAAGTTRALLFVVHAHVERLMLVLALWCVMAYLTYLQTGSTRLWMALALFYALLWAQLTYLVVVAAPQHVELRAWARPSLSGASPPAAFEALVRLQLFLPPLAALLLHLRFLPVSTPEGRRRIVAASAGIALWLVLPTLAYLRPDVLWLQILSRSATLLAGLALLLAYRPLLKASVPQAPEAELS